MDRNEFEFLFPGRRCEGMSAGQIAKEEESVSSLASRRLEYLFQLNACLWICIIDWADIWIQFGGMLATFPCKLWSRDERTYSIRPKEGSSEGSGS